MGKVQTVILLLLSLASCHSPATKNEKQAVDYVSQIFSLIDTTRIEAYQKLPFYEEIKDSLNINDSIAFLCVVNADCSHCIVELFKFVEKVCGNQKNIPLYVILQSAYMDAFKYYARKAELLSHVILIPVEEDCWEEKILLDFNELYVLCKPKSVHKFQTYPHLNIDVR